MEEVDVQNLLACRDEAHVERLPAGDPDRPEGKLECLPTDVVGRADLAGDRAAPPAVQERKLVLGVGRHQHAVERLVAGGTNTELLE
jgi:hypothetical protein